MKYVSFVKTYLGDVELVVEVIEDRNVLSLIIEKLNFKLDVSTLRLLN